MKTNHKVSFVIATHNENPETVDATIQGLLATTYYGNWREIIVVDDCSKDRYTYKHPNVIVLRNAENLGSCLSRRRGCAAACGDVLVSLDAHMSFAPGWLEEMLKYVDSGALLTPPWRNYRHTTTYHWGCSFGWQSQRFNNYSKIVGLQYHGLFEPQPMLPVVDVPMVIGACYVMRRDAYEAIGGWNPHFSIYGSEEQDLSARAWLFGNGVKCVTGARVGHLDRDGTNPTPFRILLDYYEHNQAVMIKTLFEPETTQILEDFIEPLTVGVRESLSKVDLEGWRSFLQPRRKMSDAQFFRRFLGKQSPITFRNGKPKLKKSELPRGLVQKAVLAEEEGLWLERSSIKNLVRERKKNRVRPRNDQRLGLKARRRVSLPKDVDGIGWSSSIVVEAFGLRIGFQTNVPEFLAPIAKGFAHGWSVEVDNEVDIVYTLVEYQTCLKLYVDSHVAGRIEQEHWISRKGRREVPELVAGSLRYELVERVNDHVFIDAAVVSWKGQAILILGDRWSGRTSLMFEFLKAGAEYYSHAFAAVDGDGRVLAFAQPPAFIDIDGNPKNTWPIESLNCGLEPIGVGMVVDHPLHPGVKFRPQSVSPAKTVGKLFAQTLNARRLGHFAFRSLQRAAENALSFVGPRGDMESTVAELIGRLEKRREKLGYQ
ncbi:glycosyltransferase [Algiphilus sp. NNCM1]|nr:glycosyltransferase [Algiphilus acroporae]MCI5044788.1 glycosyltransferase [Aquisalinus sp.]